MAYIAIDEFGIAHYGIMGMRWGVRRFQNEDGSLTPEGKKRYGKLESKRAQLVSQRNAAAKQLKVHEAYADALVKKSVSRKSSDFTTLPGVNAAVRGANKAGRMVTKFDNKIAKIQAKMDKITKPISLQKAEKAQVRKEVLERNLILLGAWSSTKEEVEKAQMVIDNKWEPYFKRKGYVYGNWDESPMWKSYMEEMDAAKEAIVKDEFKKLYKKQNPDMSDAAVEEAFQKTWV